MTDDTLNNDVHGALLDEAKAIPRINPFAPPDPAALDSALRRLNKACPSRSNVTNDNHPSPRRPATVVLRTRKTRYIVAQGDPRMSRQAMDHVNLNEAIVIAGGRDRLVNAVATGVVPMVVAEGVEPCFRRDDVMMLRGAYTDCLVPAEEPPDAWG